MKKQTPINKPIPIHNKHGLILFYMIEQRGQEKSGDDRFLILDSNKEYFNDLMFLEDNREEEIAEFLKFVENSTLQEMCYIYDYKIYNTWEDCLHNEYLEYEDMKTEEDLLATGYVNKIADIYGKEYYCFKL